MQIDADPDADTDVDPDPQHWLQILDEARKNGKT
jgi:hypothetical protein